MKRFLVALLFCLCSPAWADPYIQAEVRGIWGQANFEGSPTATATVGKPTLLPIETPGGIKLETSVLIKEVNGGFATVTVKIRLTPPGQSATTSEVNAVAKIGTAAHTELRLDDTRSLSLDFTILAERPKD